MSDLSALLTVPEAAKVAGVSERTMRRWATTGHVRTIGRGHKRRVLAASFSERAATNGQDGHVGRSLDGTVSATAVIESATAAEADRLAELVRELTARVSDLSATAAMWQTRAQMLDERVRALEAPKPEPARPAERAFSRLKDRRLWIVLAVAGTLAAVGLVAPAWVR